MPLHALTCLWLGLSVGPGTSTSVDFDDRDREISAAAMLELADFTPTAAPARPEFLHLYLAKAMQTLILQFVVCLLAIFRKAKVNITSVWNTPQSC